MPSTRENTIHVLERISLVIDAMAASDEPLTLSVLSETTGLPLTTAHRLLHSLLKAGLVVQPRRGRWALGIRFFELGRHVHDRIEIRRPAVPVMKALQEKTGLRILLSVPHDDKMLIIEEMLPASMTPLDSRLGEGAPMHLVASGKLFLSTYDPTELRAYATRTQLSSSTPNSLKGMDDLLVRIGRIREYGWAVGREEWRPGILCAAAPIYEHKEMVAALAIETMAAYPEEPAPDIPPTYIEWLRESAKTISHALDAVGSKPKSSKKTDPRTLAAMSAGD